MSQDYVLALSREALVVVLKLAGPALAISLGVGLVISIFQATTQIQEQTLTFVPKVLAVLFSFVIFGSFIMNSILDFTTYLFASLPGLVR